MRVLVDARAVGSSPSGIGIYGYRYIKAMLTLTDWEIVLISDVAESTNIQELTSTVKRAAGLRLLGHKISKTVGVFEYFRYVQRVIEAEKPDIFWEINHLSPIRLRNTYGSIVVTIHDLFPITMPECYSRIYPYYFRWGVSRTLGFTDGVMYVSQETKHETEVRFPVAQSCRSIISYNICVELPNTKREGGEQLASASAGDYLLYVGNLERRKGTDILIEGYRKYRASGGQLGLHLAGKLRESDIEAMVDAATNEVPGFRYLGYITDEERERELAGCAAFVFPSRAEGFGIPIIEALSYSKPVIASDLPIFEELAPNVVQTFILEGGRDSGMNSASQDGAADRLAEALLNIRPQDESVARETATRYTAEALAPRLIEFFEELAR